MKTKLIGAAAALALAVTPLASIAGGVGGGNANSNWTIYGWQNWSLNFNEFDTVDLNGGTRERDSIKMENEAANLGFAASIDTGVSVAGTAVKANFQCEQFTFFNRFSDAAFNNWCSRNSKMGLSGPWGEVMFSAWLTPYNEVTAQWIDPFYDAGQHTHSTLMGLGGFGQAYGNGGFDAAGIGNQGFMRRKPEMYQWFSPNWGGLHLRVGWSNHTVAGGNDEVQVIDNLGNVAEHDPTLLSIGAAYTHNIGNDELWLGFGYQQHDEWAAVDFACSDSDDDTWRIAGRYIHDWGNGHSTRISLAYEEMSWEWDDCAGGVGIGAANGPFDFTQNATNSVDVERDVWLISGKHDFPGPLDFRFMYQDADDFDCGGGSLTAGNDCNGISESSSGADALSLGLYYTMPAGTELRLVWGEVDNDSNSANGFGILSNGIIQGGEEENWQLGIVQWF